MKHSIVGFKHLKATACRCCLLSCSNVFHEGVCVEVHGIYRFVVVFTAVSNRVSRIAALCWNRQLFF